MFIVYSIKNIRSDVCRLWNFQKIFLFEQTKLYRLRQSM